MGTEQGAKNRIALVYGNLPTVEEIDQFRLLQQEYDVTVVSSESVCGYLTQTSWFHDLRCIPLPDHDQNPTYLPGLERALTDFDVVIVKERLGMYAYQAVKAKWKNRFRLIYWVDNATPFPGEDIDQMRTIRSEATNAADGFIVQTKLARECLELEGVESGRIMNFSPWVEARGERGGADRAKAAEALGLSDSNFIIAHFGQIEWEEGLYDLAHAVQVLRKTDEKTADKIRVVFCGIGSFANELRDRLLALGLDQQFNYLAPSRDAIQVLTTAADAVFISGVPARDRLEADPYRIVSAMFHKIPVIGSRTPLIDELLGKHRIDFCAGSASSLAKSLKKVVGATSLRNNIANKAYDAAEKNMGREQVIETMTATMAAIIKQVPTVDAHALDIQVAEVETMVASKQYLAAIDLIESIFQVKDIPVHLKANLYRLIGDSFTKLGDGDQGKVAYTQSADLDPYNAKAFIGLGTVALTKNSYDIAVLNFQKAVSLAPEDEMANLGLGLAFQGLREEGEATKWVVKALEINPENSAALFTIVQLADAQGSFAEAEQAVRKYIGMHPHDHNMVYTLAGILHKTGQSGEASQLLAKVVEVDPYDERANTLKRQIDRTLDGKAGSGTTGRS